MLWIEEGVVSQFFVKVFVSQYRKFSKENPSVFQKKPGIEKSYA